MFDFDLGVIAEHRYLTRYEVFCNRCNESIGIMDFQSIKSAIFSTYQRGGVLCPDCREKTCDVCGGISADFGHCIVSGPKGMVRACPGCEASIFELNKAAEYQISNPEGKEECPYDEVSF